METDADRDAVAQQIGREPRAFRRVAVRCPFGRPAVTEQQAYTQDGEPFPTTYYVTCRHLVAALSRIEADGGVERWSARVEAEPELAASRALADEEQRRIRRELANGATGRDGGASLELGVGGAGRTGSPRRRSRRRPEENQSASPTGSLKCLHAHAAFALARPGYELGERILGEVNPLWPPRCCSE
jgi:hypothetical protein